MSRNDFCFKDLEKDCEVELGVHQVDGRSLGARVRVPAELRQQFPYHASAYDFLQFLRREILAFGTIEFPDLPVNKSNHTLAQRSPYQHGYSPNPYLTDICQQPHQDTPPYPTAFWLPEPRRFSATWIVSTAGVQRFLSYSRQNPDLDIEQLHRDLVPQSLREGWGIVVNQTPGLILIDNSQQQSLYHARTCRFDAVAAEPDHEVDTPMYAYNEVGLLNYIDQLDIRRGQQDRDAQELAEVQQFMRAERLDWS